MTLPIHEGKVWLLWHSKASKKRLVSVCDNSMYAQDLIVNLVERDDDFSRWKEVVGFCMPIVGAWTHCCQAYWIEEHRIVGISKT